MIQPRLLVSTLFSTLTVAAIVAGCSGGGGGSLPTAPGSPSNTPAHRRERVGAVLRIHIPRKHKHRGRGAEYVSPNTLALTVGVQLVTPPGASMPLQTLVVTTPQPCAPAAGGLTCTFAVKAYVGKNVFTFNEYATKNPQPQDTPLGTLTTGATTVTSGGAALNFILDGVVNQVILSVPNPESNLSPASENTEAIPIGAPTTFPLGIDPEDFSGASIATDTFSSSTKPAPITIQVSPANSGVSLALNKKCAGDTATATKVTLNCALDLNNVTVAYDGTVTQTGANVYVDNATVVASPQLASPTPQPARIALASNVLSYLVVPAPVSSGVPSINTSNVALDPVSGNIVFAYNVNGANPALVAFNPASPATVPVPASIGFNVGFLIFDSSGHLWTNNQTSPTLQCFTSISTAGGTFAISDVLGAINNPVIAPDNSGNVWYSGLDASGYPAVGFFPSNLCTTGAPHQAQFLINSADETPYGLALAKPSGGHAAVGMVTSGNNYYTMNTATAASPTPAASWPVNEYPGGLVNDKSYNIFAGSSGSSPSVNKIAAGSTIVQTFLSLVPGSYPSGLDQYTGTQTSAQALALSDSLYGAGVFISPVAASTEPLVIPIVGSCGPVGFDKNGGAWTFCHRGDGSIWASRMVVTSTWAPFVGSVDACTPANAILGVPESSSVSSAPFSVTGNTNPSVISVGAPFPGNSPHEIPITVNNTGTATLTITDKNGRAVSVTASEIGIACSGRLPRYSHRHPRSGTMRP